MIRKTKQHLSTKTNHYDKFDAEIHLVQKMNVDKFQQTLKKWHILVQKMNNDPTSFKLVTNELNTDKIKIHA